MRNIGSVVCLVIVSGGGLLRGQTGEEQPQQRWNAHGYYAGGSSTVESAGSFQGGGGGVEAFVWKRLSAGLDGSFFQDKYYGHGQTFGHVGVQAAWHFASREKARGVDPFLLVGAGTFFPEKHAGLAAHGGAGLNYWFHRHVGARFEFRVGGRPYNDDVYGMMRLGIALR